jgi:hypothetical protein
MVCLLAGPLTPRASEADDVTVELGPGDGFAVEDSAGSERLRVQEDSGRVHAEHLILGADEDSLPAAFSSPPSLWLRKAPGNAAALIMEKGDSSFGGQLACIGRVDTSGGDDGDYTTGQNDRCGAVWTPAGHLHMRTSLVVAGDGDYRVDETTGIVTGQRGAEVLPQTMIAAFADVMGPSIVVSPGKGVNSSLAYLMSNDSSDHHHIVGALDDDAEGDEGQEGLSIYFCDPTDLGADGAITFDFDATANVIHADSGAPFAGLFAGDRIAVLPHDYNDGPPGTSQVLHEVLAVYDDVDIQVRNIRTDGAGTDDRAGIYRCDQRIYRSHATGEISVAGTLAARDRLRVPSGSDCPLTCSVGEVFMDTDSSSDANCTSSFDGAICGCYAADTWGCP